MLEARFPKNTTIGKSIYVDEMFSTGCQLPVTSNWQLASRNPQRIASGSSTLATQKLLNPSPT